MFARYVSKFDANRARMSGQIRRHDPKETPQNRREVGLGSNDIIGRIRRLAHAPFRRFALSLS